MPSPSMGWEKGASEVYLELGHAYVPGIDADEPLDVGTCYIPILSLSAGFLEAPFFHGQSREEPTDDLGRMVSI
jgi:hypothetical protein